MWLLTPILPIWSTMPAKVETTPALPGLSPVGGKPVIARFDGGQLSSDGGLLMLGEVEQRLDVAGRVAACIMDPRDPERVVHGLDEIIRFRLLMIGNCLYGVFGVKPFSGGGLDNKLCALHCLGRARRPLYHCGHGPRFRYVTHCNDAAVDGLVRHHRSGAPVETFGHARSWSASSCAHGLRP